MRTFLVFFSLSQSRPKENVSENQKEEEHVISMLVSSVEHRATATTTKKRVRMSKKKEEKKKHKRREKSQNCELRQQKPKQQHSKRQQTLCKATAKIKKTREKFSPQLTFTLLPWHEPSICPSISTLASLDSISIFHFDYTVMIPFEQLHVRHEEHHPHSP